ncbi:DUF5133 domain-containing protein [Streptomyces sp. NPDC006173]|uniref:DUF5133 domain-containing protein n=1 Tax=Streptomyces sp. NPDC006173 TaxID=3155349 RepID=UPI0033CC7935
MLMPLPATLRRLVKEYETLLAEETLADVTVHNQRLRDLAYTLCVSTGTREIAEALDTARSYLTKAPVSIPGPPAMTPGRERRAAASLKAPSDAPGFHQAIGDQSSDRRETTLRPGRQSVMPLSRAWERAAKVEAVTLSERW